jgi:hypothetical protein
MSEVDELLQAIESAKVGDCDAFADGATLDATLPNWRLHRSGADAIRTELAGWYDHPGHFERVERTPLPDGELVEYELSWDEDGVPHAMHQLHRLRTADGRIMADTIFCGGRWPASLVAEMQAADDAAR